MKNQAPLHELVVAVHTPFQDDGSLAPEVVPIQAGFLAANDIRTVFITGSTGESHLVTCQEKLTLFEAWAEDAPKYGIGVIAHVGGNCIEDAKILARRANELKFRAISALAPCYYKPGNLSALIDWCAAIAAQAPDLPFYYYDIPVLTGVIFPMKNFLKEAPARIPNLGGIKFTNSDLVSYRRALDVAGNRFDLPWGVDETLLAALATGAKGGVGSTYNWASRLYQDIIVAFNRSDFDKACSLQSVAIEMIDAIATTGFLNTAKALMARLGVPVGPARLPLGNPSSAQIDALMVKLDGMGFATWGAQPFTAKPSQLKTA